MAFKAACSCLWLFFFAGTSRAELRQESPERETKAVERADEQKEIGRPAAEQSERERLARERIAARQEEERARMRAEEARRREAAARERAEIEKKEAARPDRPADRPRGFEPPKPPADERRERALEQLGARQRGMEARYQVERARLALERAMLAQPADRGAVEQATENLGKALANEIRMQIAARTQGAPSLRGATRHWIAPRENEARRMPGRLGAAGIGAPGKDMLPEKAREMLMNASPERRRELLERLGEKRELFRDAPIAEALKQRLMERMDAPPRPAPPRKPPTPPLPSRPDAVPPAQ
ncbi:MAG: hypothetical protein BWZ10_01979 [candidate division BRC1 bacterium ADurb.BinA364]|nr:MAG: hypothetical protein BWZ10_01979 [candidate division BRC1 bacterium ADurb.BinA364]